MPKQDIFIRRRLQEFEQAVEDFAAEVMRERGESQPRYSVIESINGAEHSRVWFCAGQNNDDGQTGEIIGWMADDGAMLSVVTPGEFPSLAEAWSLLRDRLERSGFIGPGSNTWHKGKTLRVTPSSASIIRLPDGTFNVSYPLDDEHLRAAIGTGEPQPITDPTDQRIYDIVKNDPDLSDQQIGQKIGMKRQNVNRRRKKLEAMGYKVR